MAKKIKSSKVKSTRRSNDNNMQQQLLILGGVLIAAIAVVGIAIFISQQSAGTAQSIDENETYLGIPLGGEYADAREIALAEDVPETVSRGIDPNTNLPYIGNPDAPIWIVEFADFTCPFCARYHSTVEDLIADHARKGEVNVLYAATPAQVRDPQATDASRAAICAAEQGGFWEMHDEIFRVHNAESAGAFTKARLEDMANDIGLDGDAVRACISTNTADAALASATRIASEYGVTATPTMLYSFDQGATWIPFRTEGGAAAGGGVDLATMAELIANANS